MKISGDGKVTFIHTNSGKEGMDKTTEGLVCNLDSLQEELQSLYDGLCDGTGSDTDKLIRISEIKQEIKKAGKYETSLLASKQFSDLTALDHGFTIVISKYAFRNHPQLCGYIEIKGTLHHGFSTCPYLYAPSQQDFTLSQSYEHIREDEFHLTYEHESSRELDILSAAKKWISNGFDGYLFDAVKELHVMRKREATLTGEALS